MSDKSFSGLIFALMGKSASGKDSVYSRIMEHGGLGLVPVITYTTRPIRTGESDGREYFFVSEDELASFGDKVLERRDYDTEHGRWSYATMDDGQISGDGNYFLVTTPAAARELESRFGSEHVVRMLLFVDDGVRLERALNRERSQAHPRYAEMCRRFLSDAADFEGAEEGATVFENLDVDDVAAEIARHIACVIAGRG